ncbi:hypothetical protein HDZ31DRAFT_26103, partial [Schizophyllum fasciatum]
HTYLDGIRPFTSPGRWCAGALHRTAPLSAGNARASYAPRRMHHPNISPTRAGRS